MTTHPGSGRIITSGAADLPEALRRSMAAEPSRFGSPELQAMIIARCVEKDQADSVPALDRDRIREIFMAYGFTVKEGQTDLKQYVYDAADALLRAARAQADSVQEDAALQLIADLVRHIDRETCTHEETHRGGAIWEICNSCGSMWADDKGGKPEFKWPDCVEKARAFLDAARKQGANHD